MRYKVVVDNIGTVLRTDDITDAYMTFEAYKCKLDDGESVAIIDMASNDIEAEYIALIDQITDNGV